MFSGEEFENLEKNKKNDTMKKIVQTAGRTQLGEFAEIMEWSKSHVYSTFHICWGAQAGLYYHYGIPKYQVPEKIFGVFEHHVCALHEKLLRGFDDIFYVPHSRHTENHKEDILKVPELTILAEAEAPAGPYIIANLEKRQFFITGQCPWTRRAP